MLMRMLSPYDITVICIHNRDVYISVMDYDDTLIYV